MELNFGEKIKQLRRSRDLTQEALADALGISAQSVSKWECAYGYPDITQLPAIANFFGVTIDELLNNDADGKEEAMKRFEQLRQEYGYRIRLRSGGNNHSAGFRIPFPQGGGAVPSLRFRGNRHCAGWISSLRGRNE